MIYNITQINATTPQLFIKTTSDILLNGMLEEVLLIVLFFVFFIMFYTATKDYIRAMASSGFITVLLAFFAVLLEWISGWAFFIALAVYAIMLIIAYFMNR